MGFSTQPTGTTAGSVISTFTATIYDVYGNVATGYGSNVTIGVASGSGTIASGTTTRNAVGGVATFNDIIIQKADAYTLRRQSGGLTQAISNSFTITAAAASCVGFSTQPTTTVAGAVMSVFRATVYDLYANVVTGYSGDVVISVASGPGNIYSGTMTRAASSGVATFNDIVIRTAGATRCGPRAGC